MRHKLGWIQRFRMSLGATWGDPPSAVQLTRRVDKVAQNLRFLGVGKVAAGRPQPSKTTTTQTAATTRYPLLVFFCSNAFCKYFRASSRAPWVLSLVCKAWRYSLVARSR